MSAPLASPSQINDSVQCLRKWAWAKLDGVRPVQHRSAAAGERIHAILEAWLKFATPPNIEERLVLDGREYRPGLSAMNGMHHLPPPGPHNFVERAFQYGVWNGRIDFTHVTKDGIYLQPDEIRVDADDVVPEIGDHKSTGNMAYSLDETKLRSDPQGIVYANALFDDFPRVPFVRERWVYYGTSKPFPSKKVHIAVGRDEARYRLEPLDDLARGLIRLRGTSLRAMDLPPSPSACENYGGCPHKQRCNLSPAQLMSGYHEQERRRSGQMDGMEEMIKAAAEKVNGVQTPMVQVAPAPAPAQLPLQVAAPAPGCILTPGWAVHPYDNTVEWLGGEWRKMQVQAPALPAPALTPPPIPVAAAPAAPVFAPPPMVATPAPAPAAPLPPIVAVTPLVVGPDGLPPGSINPPESVGVPEKLEPSAVTAATGAKDDLDLLNKERLQELAAQMGLDVKRLREAGIREKIRAARLNGAAVGTMPSGAPVTRTAAAAVDDAAELRLDRVTQVVCTLLPLHGGMQIADLNLLVSQARKLVDAIEAE